MAPDRESHGRASAKAPLKPLTLHLFSTSRMDVVYALVKTVGKRNENVDNSREYLSTQIYRSAGTIAVFTQSPAWFLGVLENIGDTAEQSWLIDFRFVAKVLFLLLIDKPKTALKTLDRQV